MSGLDIIIPKEYSCLVTDKQDGRELERFDSWITSQGRVAGQIHFARALEKTGTQDERYFLSDGRALPHVVWREIYEGFQGRGLSLYALRRVNEHVKTEFGIPLYSDTTFLSATKQYAQGSWKTLVEQGEAEEIRSGQTIRWRMK